MTLPAKLLVTGPIVLAFGLGGCFCPRSPAVGTDGGGTPGVDSGEPTKECNLLGADSDGDGLPDTYEDVNGNGRVDPGECNPYDADTDGDGLSDTVEAGCDGLSKPGVDTRCDEADSDGDGLTDGYEDANGNGAFEPGMGETNPVNADSDGDGCTDGQEFVMMTDANNTDSDGDGISDSFEDRDCDNVFEPDDGETDPLNTDTDGDMTPDSMEPTFICNPALMGSSGGLRPVDFYEQLNGDWRIALEASSATEMRTVTYADMLITGVGFPPSDVRAGAAFDYVETPAGAPAINVAGFVMSLPLDANGDGTVDPGMQDHIGVRDRMTNLLMTVFGPGGGTSVRGLGNAVVSWEGVFDAVVNTIIEVDVTAGSNVGTLRNQLFPTFLSMPVASFTNLPASFGPTATQFVVVFETLWRAPPNPSTGFPGRAIVMGAVAERAAYDNLVGDKTSIRVSDLSNGTPLAQYGDSDDYECDPFEAVSVPKADIIWVDDDSGSTDVYRTSIKDNAVDLYDRAVGAGLDFRMGVISMGPTADGFCDPPAGAAVPGPGISCTSATPVPALYNPTATAGRWTGPTERDAFGWCICHPPDGDGGIEYGIYNGIKAVMSSIPRDATIPRRVRPDATLVVIYVGDEVPQWPGYSMPTGAISAADWAAYVQPSIDMFTGVMNPAINPAYPAGATAVDSIGRAHAIHDIDGSCGFGGVPAGVGYIDIVNAVGGVLGSVCAGSLGPTMQLIIDDIIGSSSPIVLERTPISLSLACALGGSVIDRSRSLGFDYNAAGNSIVFFGLGMMLQNADVACSYRYPIDDTPMDEGMGGGPLG
ncbi:MAG TPA: hypothetical protein VG389_09555 [Myxococcota bacterium]|jgi:hypothetical protein|nr:hypothetical protein [Myxococcota bacterium]